MKDPRAPRFCDSLDVPRPPSNRRPKPGLPEPRHESVPLLDKTAIRPLIPTRSESRIHIRPTVLLTGGAGLLGTALLNAHRDVRIIALCHRTPITSADVEVVCGDVRQSMLGIEVQRYAELVADVDVVIHCASTTNFSVADGPMMATNVDGTRQILQFAERAAARLIYVSTAFVHHQASEVEPASLYEASKRDAEALVQSSGVHHVIVRPSIIVGDSKTGAAAAYQGLHNVVGSMIDRSLPVLPATPEMVCDFVAQDWVADAIWAAAFHPTPARELWVTSGSRAMSVGAIVALASTLGEEYGFAGDPPRVVPYETLQRLFIPVFLDCLPSAMRRRFLANLKLARYMNQTVPFPSSEAYLDATFKLPPRESPEQVLLRNMRAWCEGRLLAAARRARPADSRPAITGASHA